MPDWLSILIGSLSALTMGIVLVRPWVKTQQVLNQIAAQFRTDSGSSARDILNRIELGLAQQAAIGETTREAVARLERTTIKVEARLDASERRADAVPAASPAGEAADAAGRSGEAG